MVRSMKDKTEISQKDIKKETNISIIGVTKEENQNKRRKYLNKIFNINFHEDIGRKADYVPRKINSIQSEEQYPSKATDFQR